MNNLLLVLVFGRKALSHPIFSINGATTNDMSWVTLETGYENTLINRLRSSVEQSVMLIVPEGVLHRVANRLFRFSFLSPNTYIERTIVIVPKGPFIASCSADRICRFIKKLHYRPGLFTLESGGLVPFSKHHLAEGITLHQGTSARSEKE